MQTWGVAQLTNGRAASGSFNAPNPTNRRVHPAQFRIQQHISMCSRAVKVSTIDCSLLLNVFTGRLMALQYGSIVTVYSQLCPQTLAGLAPLSAFGCRKLSLWIACDVFIPGISSPGPCINAGLSSYESFNRRSSLPDDIEKSAEMLGTINVPSILHHSCSNYGS